MERVFSCGVITSVIAAHTEKEKVLLDIVKSAFYFSKSQHLSKNEIVEVISNNYNLTILSNELTKCLEREDVFICNSGNYSLIETMTDNYDILGSYIDDIFKNSKYPTAKASEVIYNYLYQLFYNQFDSLVKSMPNIEKKLSIKVIEDKVDMLSKIKLSNEDRDIVNIFLDYDSMEKNKLVYSIINNAIDFIGVVGGKPIKFDRSSLANRTFYLDNNVLFRAIGLNGEERKESILEFMNITSQSGLNPRFAITSLTKQEFIDTIRYTCRLLKQGGMQRVKSNQKSFFDSNSRWSIYLKWKLNRKENSVEDFEKWCISSMTTFLHNNNVKEVFVEKPKSQDFTDLCSRFIHQTNRSNSEKSSEIDMANVLWIKESRRNVSDLRESSTFFITCDGQLINFCRQQNMLDKSVCFLPSFWLSLFLEFSGRVDNESALKCFTNFLKVRTSNDKADNENIAFIIGIVNEKIEDESTANICIESIIQQKIIEEAEGLVKLTPEQIKEIAETEITKITINIDKLSKENLETKEVLNEQRETIDILLEEKINKIRKSMKQWRIVCKVVTCFVVLYLIYSIAVIFKSSFEWARLPALQSILEIEAGYIGDFISVLMSVMGLVVAGFSSWVLKKIDRWGESKIKEYNTKYGS